MPSKRHFFMLLDPISWTLAIIYIFEKYICNDCIECKRTAVSSEYCMHYHCISGVYMNSVIRIKFHTVNTITHNACIIYNLAIFLNVLCMKQNNNTYGVI